MSTVNGTSGNNSTSGSSSELPRQAVNLGELSDMENSFITLLVAQVQYQDPTKPVDSTEFINQYSAMAQVKSMQNMTTLQQNNLVLMDNLQTLTAAGLVGQEVKVSADSLQLDAEKVSGQIALQHASATTVLQLTDANGIRTDIALGPQEPGSVPFTVDPVALGLKPGKYTLAVKTESGEAPGVEVSGLVNNVRVSADGPVLDVQGAGSVPFYKIVEFSQGQAA
ncbi:flagellar hook assembly protein FlgD [Pseudomonas sp. ZM23]|uniref:Basal-body rod modification protein FlgD n=1 Tax=Pseudomonas triclosanedens TaxID=2961893 RepID=A0ABY6ZYZ9_9PSED|nr:flagellar hook capping FlgD N-terminal domain-containing protein [Pseudomonas triclosanedens]MCP8462723.1 flagellar hook assembly protein FlgD [Pseudomonas triclosanedens]MCP8468342.1 flagellar hook assembly protein FlgD [Pseudomonas triclosanedens]MCP8475101.1 flagellar hook assembly protein FlgD [Pseudomonas triclosanedens]WAI49910.1 flagellar hook assembly protein FlgD [Pseudomonas triclosanedens]